MSSAAVSPAGRCRRSGPSLARRSIVAAVALLPAGPVAAWWWVTTPRLQGDLRRHEHLDGVEVTVRIGGRTSTVLVPLGYVVAYTDDPAGATADHGVSVLEPSR